MSIEAALASIEKRFGKGAVIAFSDKASEGIDVISTRCLGLDEAIGVGGIPRGRITELFGSESSGKTTIALQTVAEAQKQGGKVAYIDAEHALDPLYANNLGVQLDKMLICQPDSAEQALEIVEELVRSNEVALIVVDSVAALVPQSELNGEMGDAQMGVMARLMSQAMRKLTAITANSNTALLFINQTRDKIGVMWGSPVTTPGGKALKFYASLRLEISRIAQLKSGEELTGNRTKVKVVKNKLAPPFKTCEFDIIYGEGISQESEIIDKAIEKEIFQKSGAWISYNGEHIGQGKEKAKIFLKENPEILEKIKEQIQNESVI